VISKGREVDGVEEVEEEKKRRREEEGQEW
jgi:hypothetical protein